MRLLEDIKMPVCLSMGVCAVRTFIHSLITEEERFITSKVNQDDYLNYIKYYIFIIELMILFFATCFLSSREF